MKERDLSLDLLRGIAIILVVFIHVTPFGFVDSDSLNFDATIIFRQIINFAVPLFLFISGYLMANKSLSSTNEYFSYLKKQLPRVLLPYIVWSVLYSLIFFALGINAETLLFNFLTFQVVGPFYFIALICQCYLLQPLLKSLSKSFGRLLLSLLISLSSCAVLFYLRYYRSIDIPLYIYGGIVSTWIFFPVLGMYFNSNKINVSKGILSVVTVILLLFSLFETKYILDTFDDLSNAVSAVKLSSFLYSASAITLLFTLRNSIPKSSSLFRISELSFGIYFSHMLVLTVIQILFKRFVPITITSNIVTQIAVTVIIIICCMVIGQILRKINKTLASKYFGF